MNDELNEFRDVFFEEAGERITELENNVLSLETDPSGVAIDAVFRAAHSLKGASGTFGFVIIERFTHDLETLLANVRNRVVAPGPEVVGVVLRAVDIIKALVANEREGKPLPAGMDEVTAALVDVLKNAARVEAKRSDAPKVEGEKAAPLPDTHVDVSTLRVPASKLDQLVDLVGELVIAQSMLIEVLRREGATASSEVREAASHVERSTRELQEHCMDVRMVPVGIVLARFPRLVRDLAASSGKKISLVLEGEQTELDKSLVERLADPLTHLVRNAIDHGIEKPESRRADGKSETGTVRIVASTRGGSVLIEVRDDGRGINHAKIRERAIERGLISENQVLAKAELEALIFAPGFSTADSVSAISGRGVGMDVVKSTVESLGGGVSISSEPGVGTTTRLKLPLTLAMLSGMSLSVGEQTYILPVLAIVESLRPRRENVKAVLGRGEVLLLRGEALPIVHLYKQFAHKPRSYDACEAILVVVENEGRRVALQVDELLGEHQVVVKSLDTNYQRVEGIMGATVMGDGRVALILDAPSLVRARLAREDETFQAAVAATSGAVVHHGNA
jgi:two-component system chemotaxis sensor kinase CheA